MNFVRQSKFRHVYAKPMKQEFCLNDVRITKITWDSLFSSVNPKFIAVILEGAGGPFTVIPLTKVGRVEKDYPIVDGHRGACLEVAFCPFNDNIIASCSEDTTAKVWQIPDTGLRKNLTEPLVELCGHQKRVSSIVWHPSANSVLLTAGGDQKILIWNVGTGEALIEIAGHPDLIWSVSFNYDGSKIVTTCKDRRLRVIDPRSGKIIQQGMGHEGVKPQRAIFLKDGRILTTGFTKRSERMYALRNEESLEEPIVQEDLDTSNGVMYPIYDQDTGMLYLCGKGDCAIRYYEVNFDPPFVHYINVFTSSEPQRGIAFMPKRGVTAGENEIARMYKCTNKGLVEVVQFYVPRKSELFQDDLYPDTAAATPAISAEDWMSGKNADPVLKMNSDDIKLEIETADDAASQVTDVINTSRTSPRKQRRSTSTNASQPKVEETFVDHNLSGAEGASEDAEGPSAANAPNDVTFEDNEDDDGLDIGMVLPGIEFLDDSDEEDPGADGPVVKRRRLRPTITPVDVVPRIAGTVAGRGDQTGRIPMKNFTGFHRPQPSAASSQHHSGPMTTSTARMLYGDGTGGMIPVTSSTLKDATDDVNDAGDMSTSAAAALSSTTGFCPNCGQQEWRFSRRNVFLRHVRNCGGKHHKCDYCDRAFATSFYRNTHQRKCFLLWQRAQPNLHYLGSFQIKPADDSNKRKVPVVPTGGHGAAADQKSKSAVPKKANILAQMPVAAQPASPAAGRSSPPPASAAVAKTISVPKEENPSKPSTSPQPPSSSSDTGIVAFQRSAAPSAAAAAPIEQPTSSRRAAADVEDNTVGAQRGSAAAREIAMARREREREEQEAAREAARELRQQQQQQHQQQRHSMYGGDGPASVSSTPRESISNVSLAGINMEELLADVHKLKVVIRQHERRIRFLEETLAERHAVDVDGLLSPR